MQYIQTVPISEPTTHSSVFDWLKCESYFEIKNQQIGSVRLVDRRNENPFGEPISLRFWKIIGERPNAKLCWINLCQWLSCSTGLGTNINHCPNKPQNTYFYPFVLKQEKPTSSLCQMLSSGTTRSSTIDKKQILKLNSNWNRCIFIFCIFCCQHWNILFA